MWFEFVKLDKGDNKFFVLIWILRKKWLKYRILRKRKQFPAKKLIIIDNYWINKRYKDLITILEHIAWIF